MIFDGKYFIGRKILLILWPARKIRIAKFTVCGIVRE